ncbi:MAG: tRNA pseudouridine(55) synthase TruB [Defluviitaleaceae bacterium]|nr:tRNA pseudouridine(55) synthase TruB [Defluviitaleaceae bacterium]
MKQENNSISGVINICKEKDYTSHDVVAIVRKITRAKAGHTGTLDPNATGVLPVCLGRATKFADYFAAQEKSYSAEIVPGITTDTGDITGTVLQHINGSGINLEKIRIVAETFLYENRGDYMQTPPMYSAIKIGGKKLYELARKGQTIERPARKVKIFAIGVREESSRFYLDVSCSKGTYIRSLCMDIGEALGCGAVMGDLVRTRSGSFCIKNSFTLAEVKNAAEAGRLQDLILPVNELLPYPAAQVKPEGLARAKNGNPLPVQQIHWDGELEKKIFILDNSSNIIGLFFLKNESYRAEVML